MELEQYTPMMRQYLEIKNKHKDAIVFFRLGDFYEMFFSDATEAALKLEIALTKKSAGNGIKVDMCGVPHHSANSYIQKLVDFGYKVAIAEQIEDASEAKGLVKRDVVNVISPGTIIDVDSLDKANNNFIAALTKESDNYYLTYADVTTGDIFSVYIDSYTVLISELTTLNIKEMVLDPDFSIDIVSDLKNAGVFVSYHQQNDVPPFFKALENSDKSEHSKSFILLIGYLLNYQSNSFSHFKKVFYYSKSNFMQIDSQSMRNLEIVETLRSREKKGTLLSFIDECKTAAGSRLLKKWINNPLIEKNEILKRHDLVDKLNDNFFSKSAMSTALKGVYDFERLIFKIVVKSVNPRDLVNLNSSIKKVPILIDELCEISEQYANELSDNYDKVKKISDKITSAIMTDSAVSTKDGNFINDNYNEELDKYRDIINNGSKYILDLEQKYRAEFNIKNLKISFNRVFGYYIEVTKSNIGQIKDEYGLIRKQTLANAERYISNELKDLEMEILTSKTRASEIEQDIFNDIRNELIDYIEYIQNLSRVISELDCLIALSDISIKHSFVRPNIGNELKIVEGYHPVLMDKMRESFIKNDLDIADNRNLLLMTGPNMGGKSTFMRQIAVIVILNQIGSFVPAKQAVLPVFDKIFTRIGSADDMTSNQSTFMVEMLEANNAIVNATENSLILFDEIGRGTATYDGIALAQSIIEYISKNIGCLTIFSTHYHELVKLEDSIDNLRNIHVSAVSKDNKITFLYEVKDGYIDKSFGINVASLANLPDELLNRAVEVLHDLEGNYTSNTNKVETNLVKTVTNENQNDIISEILDSVNINNITPIEALNILNDIYSKYK